jgi:hypothetical protein
VRYVGARKEKRHESSKMETTLHNMVNKCIPEADKCVDGDGDKRFNLVVSNARSLVIANDVLAKELVQNRRWPS